MIKPDTSMSWRRIAALVVSSPILAIAIMWGFLAFLIVPLFFIIASFIWLIDFLNEDENRILPWEALKIPFAIINLWAEIAKVKLPNWIEFP